MIQTVKIRRHWYFVLNSDTTYEDAYKTFIATNSEHAQEADLHRRLHEEFHSHDSNSEGEIIAEEEQILEEHPLCYQHLECQADGYDKEAFERYLDEQNGEILDAGFSDTIIPQQGLQDTILRMSKLSACEVPIFKAPDKGTLHVFEDMKAFVKAFKDPNTAVPEHFTGTQDFRNWQDVTTEMKVITLLQLSFIAITILAFSRSLLSLPLPLLSHRLSKSFASKYCIPYIPSVLSGVLYCGEQRDLHHYIFMISKSILLQYTTSFLTFSATC